MTSLASGSAARPDDRRVSMGRIVDVARDQHGLVSRSQLLAAGLSPKVILGWQRDLRLLPAGRGVYALGRRTEGRIGACMAAALVVGEGTAISGRSAAFLWGIDKYRGDITVAHHSIRRPSRFQLDPRGVAEASRVRVRRNRNLRSKLITRRYGIPVLRPAWLMLELAGDLNPEAFGRIFKEADRLNLLDEGELRKCASCGSGFAGITELRKLVNRRHPDSKETRSLLEVLFLEICREFGIEKPKVNRPRVRYYPDFRWEDIGLIVEVDGYEGHAGRFAFLDDAARENDLRAQGYQVIRFTWEQVTEQPEVVAALVKQEIARCRILAASRHR